jgi:(2Fe-2S) ferredoxin
LSYYKRHIFFCCNNRGPGAERPSCDQFGGQELRDYAKAKLKKLGQHGEGKTRVNQAGCLDRCECGPVCVIYPEATWYTFVDEEDIDEIIDKHLLGGEEVERLKI